MKDLDEALAEIAAIRGQIARAHAGAFRGYGPATLAATGGLAWLAAVAQALWLPDAAERVGAWMALWCATAAVSVALVGAEAVTRTRRAHSALAQEMLAEAVGQFLPAAVAGALLAAVLLRFVPEAAWMLPGLWQVVFGLGVFASYRFLPWGIFAVGVWYLGAGLVCLAFARGAEALSPWAMGVPFGVGQMLAAAVLWWGLRREAGDGEGT